MKNNRKYFILGVLSIYVITFGCVPYVTKKSATNTLPQSFKGRKDSTNIAPLTWKEYFTDENLVFLVETMLNNNQELNIASQEIIITKSEVKARKGEYLPFMGLGVGSGIEKHGRYTRNGAFDATNNIIPGQKTPEPLPNFVLGAYASWEIDVWKKLRNAKKAAVLRYLSSIEGKKFLTTILVAEIANSYFELLALDNQLEIINQNIEIQSNALQVIKMEKEAARLTELAVKRFEAQLLHTKSLQYAIQQRIFETENKINFLCGTFEQPIKRTSKDFVNISMINPTIGTPEQLLENRPDIKKAELLVEASKLDVKVAKAHFYPSLGIHGGIGLQSISTTNLLKAPESLLYDLAGEIASPLINRNSIKAMYLGANAKQIQQVFQYEQTLLKAYLEVVNQLSNIKNLQHSFQLISEQVQKLDESTAISTNLFKNARADYVEVLMTQRDAIESKFELIETKKQQLNAQVSIYRALGGGW